MISKPTSVHKGVGEYLDSLEFWTDFWFLNSLFIVLLTTKSSLFCQINRCKSTIVPVYQTVSSRASERHHDGVSVGGLVAISKESKIIVEFFFAVGFEGAVATIFQFFVALVSAIRFGIGWLSSLSSSSMRIVVSSSGCTDLVGLPGLSRPPRKPPDKPHQSKSRSPVDC